MLILNPSLILSDTIDQSFSFSLGEKACLQRAVRQKDEDHKTPESRNSSPDQEDIPPTSQGAAYVANAKGSNSRYDL